MNFALSTKYSEIDLEEVSPADLVLVGGGCGESGGGSVSVSSVQSTAQSYASAPGANSRVSVSVISPADPVIIPLVYTYIPSRGGSSVSGNASVSCTTGGVTENSGGGRFWESMSFFFGWLYGSH